MPWWVALDVVAVAGCLAATLRVLFLVVVMGLDFGEGLMAIFIGVCLGAKLGASFFPSGGVVLASQHYLVASVMAFCGAIVVMVVWCVVRAIVEAIVSRSTDKSGGLP